jgi:hypothetical protein
MEQGKSAGRGRSGDNLTCRIRTTRARFSHYTDCVTGFVDIVQSLFCTKNKSGLFSGGNSSLVALDDPCSAESIHHRDNAGVGIEDWFPQPRQFPAGRLVEDAGHVLETGVAVMAARSALEGESDPVIGHGRGGRPCAEFAGQSLDHAFLIVVQAAQCEEDGMADFVRLQHRPRLGERLAPVEHSPQEVCGG